MSAEPPDPAALEKARQELTDPALREWKAPAGVRSEPAGIRASLEAMRLKSVVESRGEEIVFEAWRSPRTSGAALAGMLAVGVYLGLDRLGVSEFTEIVAVVLVAWYVPLWLLPTYRVSGKVGGGMVRLRVSSRGLFARKARFEEALRFYLHA